MAVVVVALVVSAMPAPATAATQAPAKAGAPSWGAIAARDAWFGYSFNLPTRTDAERAARSQCDRASGRAGPCEVRAFFDRSCAALARGNYGEWATANAETAPAAGQAAVTQCNGFLPTEPCKVVVSVCSPQEARQGQR
ncbi:MAG: DUF4189 domain-containing protein [Gammaproteobacteria bacterium]|nr:DUF4189 domain-containing protein [Gammaproteobacteria bacterium]MBU1440539.1 DUF4189 domain-containing protein [Gammaproteobacteria bacterium]MBU2285372.1 DUF4189 domain-containing protein [Gammaproteobacteria bacterium]MBU2409544.1 DUF4189 domain-containing protein [Gammaproteobacteria bacterium]